MGNIDTEEGCFSGAFPTYLAIWDSIKSCADVPLYDVFLPDPGLDMMSYYWFLCLVVYDGWCC